jgi:hypothetical protein
MEEIRKILKLENPSFDELIQCFEIIKDDGAISVIKFDGARKENQYTVFISFSSNREMIRIDSDNLRTALIKALQFYINE